MILPGQLEREFTLKGLWWLAIAAVFLCVIVFAAVQTARIEGFKLWPVNVKGYKVALSDEQAAHRTCAKKLTVSNASIDTLQVAIDDLNRQAKARAAAFAATQRNVRAREAELARRAIGSDQLIDRLRQRAAAGGGACATPKDLANMAEGL